MDPDVSTIESPKTGLSQYLPIGGMGVGENRESAVAGLNARSVAMNPPGEVGGNLDT